MGEYIEVGIFVAAILAFGGYGVYQTIKDIKSNKDS